MSTIKQSRARITNGNADVESAYADYVQELLGYGANLRALFEAADANPDCTLLNANAAALHLAFEGREGWDDAAPYLTRMQQHRAGITEREDLFCRAVLAWAAQDFRAALDLFSQIARDCPDDLVSIKWGQYHAFNLGDQAAMLHLGALAVQACRDTPYVHGLYAFALEQNHHVRAAEKEARHAVEIAIDDVWAQHAGAHVMETERRIAEGASWLSHCSHIWASKGTFIREHNWWHTALFHLALGEQEKVYDIFDTWLWGEWPEFPQEQIGAASLLWRLELNGLDAGSRWQPLIEQAQARSGDHIFPFHDLHYLFAISHAEDPLCAEKHVTNMRQKAQSCSGETAIAWQKAGLPAAAGILAFARGAAEEAVHHLEQALPHLEKIGGSHAQRAIFHQTCEVAKQRAAGQVAALGE
ncbi:MAG: hypothetical protein MRY72_14125 [Aquisalinus sp.]|nr:hypothetical protein [Aquisalinus sp.]